MKGCMSLMWMPMMLLAILFTIAVALSSSPNPIMVQHDKFTECIALEYPRDFCLALVDDD